MGPIFPLATRAPFGHKPARFKFNNADFIFLKTNQQLPGPSAKCSNYIVGSEQALPPSSASNPLLSVQAVNISNVPQSQKKSNILKK